MELKQLILEKAAKDIAATDGKPFIRKSKGRFYLWAKIPMVPPYSLEISADTEDELLFKIITSPSWVRPIVQELEHDSMLAYIEGLNKKEEVKAGLNQVVLTKLDYNDLDNMASAHYGKRFESVPYEEWGNGQSHEYDMQVEPLEEYDLESREEWLAGREHTLSVHVAMQDLVNAGILNPGTYLIEVYW